MAQRIRQRSLIPLGERAAIDGWMDEDVAAAATQLFSSGPKGLLVVDARELIATTAMVVGAQLGELHLKVMMAIITLHVGLGMPEDGWCETSIGELCRLIWGEDRARGGKNTRHLLKVLFDLQEAKFTVPGYDFRTQSPDAGVSSTSLLISLRIDATMLRAFQREEQLSRSEVGRAVGKRRGTVSWQLHPTYTQRLAESDLRRFNWSLAQQLRGVALSLWMVFSSPRVPYRPALDQPDDLELVEVPLTTETCYALGVYSTADAGRRRTLNLAGERVCSVDTAFTSFEALGGRGRDSFLRVVRKRGCTPPVEPARQVLEQLAFAA